MSNDPDVRFRIQIGDVVVEIHSDRIEQRLLEEAFLQAGLVATISSRMTTTHGRPGRSDFGTTAREEKVVVQFVFPDCGASVSNEPEGRRSFDRDNHGAVIRRHEYVAPEPIRVGLPTKWIRLENQVLSA